MQSIKKRWTPIAARFATALLLASGLGCAFGEIYWDDPMKREYALSEAQSRYTSLIRFGAIGQAAKFVDPEASSEFITEFPDMSELTFTDSKSGPIQFTGEEDERRTAEVRVTYAAYHAFTLIVFDVVEVQEWYREGAGNNWFVRPHFEGLEQFASAE
jgi:hypothetical protein